MSPHRDTYEAITARMLAALDAGVPPWHRPWKTSAAVNVRTGRAYRGINVLLLALENRADPRWGTFRAWKETGANVRRGEHGARIVLWKRQQRRQTAEERAAGEEPTFYAFMREYVVFNGEQVENAPALETGEPFEPLERAESILEGMPNRPVISYGGNRAYYSPASDSVTLPAPDAFESPAAFYVTAFHELTHATGAECRLGGLEPATFGTDPYAREELIAELGAAFLAGSAELSFALETSAAYLEGWRTQLTRDPRLIVSAASEAQRRADYVLGVSWNADGSREAESHAIAA